MKLNEKCTMNEIVLASLFHDIGKFAQRTGKKDLRKSEMEGQLCKKSDKGDFYTHQHVLYSLGAIESIRDSFPSGIRTQIIANLAAAHHNPSSTYEKIVSIADQISSGSDRMREDKEEQNKEYCEIPLRNILDSLSIFPDSSNRIERGYQLAPLQPSTIFPSKATKLSKIDYESLWNDFYNDAKSCKDIPCDQYIPAIDAVFERYLWCIPSSTVDDPDISLYDHSSTTSAFASVLYRYFEDSGKFDNQSDLNENERPFLFVNGDVSGIQRYIFDLKTSESNAKLLRARSFDIQCLTEKAVEILLRSFNLPKFCTLMNAGGRFLVLLPNTQDAKDKIAAIRKDIESFFINRYFGEVAITVSPEIASNRARLQQKDISTLFAEINIAAIRAKQSKFSSFFLNSKDHVIDHDYQEIQETGRVCPICEKRAGTVNKAEAGEENHYICRVCNELIKKGEKLPKAVCLARKADTQMAGTESVFLYTEEESSHRKNEILYRINSYKSGYGFLPMPYHIPRDHEEGQVLTFEDLAERAKGIKKLAMLKADVDNLGAVFSIGLGKRRSISRYAMLSRTLNYFFTNYINAAIKEQFSDIYTVFSGGDDLCVIGPWNIILEFARFIRHEFNNLTGNNNSLTLSAGISLASPNLPVGTMAEEAERLLKLSKEPDTAGRKDKVTVFGTTVSWHDFGELLQEGKWLDKSIKAGSVKPALLYRLMKYHEMEKSIDKPISNALWRSHFFYDVTRNIEDTEIRNKVKEFVNTHIKNLRLPISYAIYMNRKEGKR